MDFTWLGRGESWVCLGWHGPIHYFSQCSRLCPIKCQINFKEKLLGNVAGYIYSMNNIRNRMAMHSLFFAPWKTCLFIVILFTCVAACQMIAWHFCSHLMKMKLHMFFYFLVSHSFPPLSKQLAQSVWLYSVKTPSWRGKPGLVGWGQPANLENNNQTFIKCKIAN